MVNIDQSQFSEPSKQSSMDQLKTVNAPLQEATKRSKQSSAEKTSQHTRLCSHLNTQSSAIVVQLASVSEGSLDSGAAETDDNCNQYWELLPEHFRVQFLASRQPQPDANDIDTVVEAIHEYLQGYLASQPPPTHEPPADKNLLTVSAKQEHASISMLSELSGDRTDHRRQRESRYCFEMNGATQIRDHEDIQRPIDVEMRRIISEIYSISMEERKASTENGGGRGSQRRVDDTRKMRHEVAPFRSSVSPFRPCVPDCLQYLKHNRCEFGNYCPHNHPTHYLPHCKEPDVDAHLHKQIYRAIRRQKGEVSTDSDSPERDPREITEKKQSRLVHDSLHTQSLRGRVLHLEAGDSGRCNGKLQKEPKKKTTKDWRFDIGSSSRPEENGKPKTISLPIDVINIPISSLDKIRELQYEGRVDIFKVVNRLAGKRLGKTIKCIYSRLRKHQIVPHETAKVDWRPYYGQVKDQEGHDICWAIVSAELVTALRWIKGRDQTGIEYSYQELVDFVFPEKGRKRKDFPNHCCYTLNIPRGLTYGKEQGMQRAVDRPWDGCKPFPPPRVLSHADLGYIGNVKRIKTIEEALVHLQYQPLGAAMPIFCPDYCKIGGGIYRGPMFTDSVFLGMHAVSITGAGTRNGESFMYVRSSHGEKIGRKGYLRVSIDVLIQRLSTGQEHERKYFTEPTPLLDRFCCPELLTESEEMQMKRKIWERRANRD